MSGYPIVTVGASAGGVEAVINLVKQLPDTFLAPLLVVLHFPPSSTSLLPSILNRLTHLSVLHPHDGDPIEPGKIYAALPDHHLVVQHNRIHLNRGARENGYRPSIDTLFRSAAYAYGSQVISVLLSGTLDDGTAGMITIKARGGTTIVQDPEEALFNGMLYSAINNVGVDHILKTANIASLLVELTRRSAPATPANLDSASSLSAQPNPAMPDPDQPNLPIFDPAIPDPTESDALQTEGQIVAQNKATLEQGKHPNQPSMLTCPDCGGVLWELQEGNLIRYRCHVGHAYSLDSLLIEQEDDLERALWSAIRTLEEKAALARRMATQARQQNRLKTEKQFSLRAEEAGQNADTLRQMVERHITLKASNGGSHHSVSLPDQAANQIERS